MWQKLCHLFIIVIKLRFFHFDNYSTWWHLAVFQTVQTHAQPLFYAHQYFQVRVICPNSYEKLTKSEIILCTSVFSGLSKISKYLYYSTDKHYSVC